MGGRGCVCGGGSGGELVAALAPLLVAMSSGPGLKMKQSVSCAFFFLNPLSCLLQVHNDSDVICYSASR